MSDPQPERCSSGAVLDTFWRGRLRVWQPQRQKGYRFTLDAVLLAAFAPAGARVLDLGSGCGIVGLLLLAAGKAAHVTAVERQPHLAALCRRNAHENGWAKRLQVVEGDLRQVLDPAALPYDVVVFNPPYFPLRAGRRCPEPGRDAARNECHGTLADFAAAAAQALKPGGHAAAIVAAERAGELLGGLQAQGVFCRRRRLSYAREAADGAPRHCLLAGVLSPPPHAAPLPPAWGEPLLLHGATGRTFSPEVARWVDGPGP